MYRIVSYHFRTHSLDSSSSHCPLPIAANDVMHILSVVPLAPPGSALFFLPVALTPCYCHLLPTASFPDSAKSNIFNTKSNLFGTKSNQCYYNPNITIQNLCHHYLPLIAFLKFVTFLRLSLGLGLPAMQFYNKQQLPLFNRHCSIQMIIIYQAGAKYTFYPAFPINNPPKRRLNIVYANCASIICSAVLRTRPP